jgi:hypothetical protein
MINKEFVKELRGQVADLLIEYRKAKELYDNAGMNAELKVDALQAMANLLQLQNIAILNLNNFNNALSLQKTDTRN